MIYSPRVRSPGSSDERKTSSRNSIPKTPIPYGIEVRLEAIAAIGPFGFKTNSSAIDISVES